MISKKKKKKKKKGLRHNSRRFFFKIFATSNVSGGALFAWGGLFSIFHRKSASKAQKTCDFAYFTSQWGGLEPPPPPPWLRYWWVHINFFQHIQIGSAAYLPEYKLNLCNKQRIDSNAHDFTPIADQTLTLKFM